MTFDEIRENLKNNKYEYLPTTEEKEIMNRRSYSEYAVIDEDQSVKWNREEAKKRNNEKNTVKINVREKGNVLRTQFWADLGSAILEDLDNMSVKDIKPILEKARQSDTLGEGINAAEELVDIIRNLF